MGKIAAKWKLKSCILKCPGCGRYLMTEFIGSWKVRKPSKLEFEEARACGRFFEEFNDSPPSPESTVSGAHARRGSAVDEHLEALSDGRRILKELSREPPDDEGCEKHDGA